ncbi:MAG TPA: TRAP transporter small permease [Beijerinckiaceae bacterium]|jgi:TRAP-type C4-dicarboxylate transport system permease small subunit
MDVPPETPPEQDRSVLGLVSSVVAMIGGALAFALAVLVTTSVLMRWLFDAPVPGDFEFVQMGTALIVFAYLPFCQMQRGNIIVDAFTGRLSDRARARIDALWDVVYAVVIGVIAYAMVQGVIDAWNSGEETMVSRIRLWPALAICTTLAAFLSLCALYTAARLLRSAR